MGPFMVSSVNVALPTIQQEFAADAVALSRVATALLLSVAVFLIPLGKIGDIYGRKTVFTLGLVVDTLASLAGAFSVSMPMLITVRVFQGFGTAMFVTTGMAIVTSVFPPQRRGRAIGLYVSAVYIGLSVGPFAGGTFDPVPGLAEQFRRCRSLWRGIDLGHPQVSQGRMGRCQRREVGCRRESAICRLCLSVGLRCFPPPRRPAVYLILTGAVALTAFVRFELRTPQPVFDVRLFIGNRLFAFSCLVVLINYAATFAITFLISLFLQYIKGLTPQ